VGEDFFQRKRDVHEIGGKSFDSLGILCSNPNGGASKVTLAIQTKEVIGTGWPLEFRGAVVGKSNATSAVSRGGLIPIQEEIRKRMRRTPE